MLVKGGPGVWLVSRRASNIKLKTPVSYLTVCTCICGKVQMLRNIFLLQIYWCITLIGLECHGTSWCKIYQHIHELNPSVTNRLSLHEQNNQPVLLFVLKWSILFECLLSIYCQFFSKTGVLSRNWHEKYRLINQLFPLSYFIIKEG